MIITALDGTRHNYRSIISIVRRGSKVEGAEVLEVITADSILHEITVSTREAQRSEGRARHLFMSYHAP